MWEPIADSSIWMPVKYGFGEADGIRSVRTMPRNLVGTIFKIAVLSLIVGLVLSALDISPARILEGLGVTARDAIDTGASVVAWALEYIIVGAAIVVPIWLIVAAIGSRRRGN